MGDDCGRCGDVPTGVPKTSDLFGSMERVGSMFARINRKVLVGIIGAALMVVTLGTVSAGAAAPGHYGYCGPGVYCGVPYAGNFGYYGGVAGGPTYFDPRYCPNGLVSIVPEPTNGVPINVCTLTGQRIFPVFPDFVPVGGYYPAPVAYNPVVYRPYVYQPYVYHR